MKIVFVSEIKNKKMFFSERERRKRLGYCSCYFRPCPFLDMNNQEAKDWAEKRYEKTIRKIPN